MIATAGTILDTHFEFQPICVRYVCRPRCSSTGLAKFVLVLEAVMHVPAVSSSVNMERTSDVLVAEAPEWSSVCCTVRADL